MNSDKPLKVASVPGHHKKLEYCFTRKPYRKGKKSTAVKVFTVNNESKYVIATNVHATGLVKDLVKAFSKYGTVIQCEELKDYPREPFTQVFLLKYSDIQSARIAKKRMDEYYFFGSTLHVFYAPEYETVEDTRSKLMYRRAAVVSRIRSLAREATASSSRKTDDNVKNSSIPAKTGYDKAPKSSSGGAFANLTTSCIQGNTFQHSNKIIGPSVSTPVKVNPTNGNPSLPTPSFHSIVDHHHPPKKKPKLIRLPGYVPPHKAAFQ